ncbi:MAG: phenylalanine--tRNA ligase subunit alpha [Planctomycetota bacterium]
MSEIINENIAAEIMRAVEAELADSAVPEIIEAVRVKYLGRKGKIASIMDSIKLLPADSRPAAGKLANQLKSNITKLIEEKKSLAGTAQAPCACKKFDITLPGKCFPEGAIHPISVAIEEICSCMTQLGFEYTDGPDIEDEFHNFIGLNIPPNHPARDPESNFYLLDNMLLRSQTSTVQIRYMEKHKPPVRIFALGKVFRPDTADASHYHMFHQVEGLWVEKGVTFSHLKSVLMLFGRLILGKDAKIRLRPSFFPFTEPSAEIDFSCFICGGSGCSACSRKGWVEMGGCGMVDPNVLKVVNIDPEENTGFAFGIGIDRLVMARHKIDDIRLLFGNDIRFLNQF